MTRFVALVFALAVFGAAGPAAATTRPRPVVVTSSDFAQRVLGAHNGERARLRLPLLQWSPALEANARAWASEMARSGRYVHSANASRPGEGESLFRHTAGAYSLEQMVGTFLAERPNFKPGVFPDIARDGNWMRAGHYSQVIWPTTTHVGCAMVVARGMDWFVCRYAPAGNVRGQKVGHSLVK